MFLCVIVGLGFYLLFAWVESVFGFGCLFRFFFGSCCVFVRCVVRWWSVDCVWWLFVMLIVLVYSFYWCSLERLYCFGL